MAQLARDQRLWGWSEPDFRPPAGAMVERMPAGRPAGWWSGWNNGSRGGCRRSPKRRSRRAPAVFSRELAAAGVTAFTDATVRNGPDEVALFARLAREGAICQRVGMMIGARAARGRTRGDRGSRAVGGIGIAGGKFMPRIARRTAWRSRRARRSAFRLRARLRLSRHRSRGAGDGAGGDRSRAPAGRGAGRGDGVCRIEHGGLIPPNYIERMAATPERWVVTNPGFIYYRGDKYAQRTGTASAYTYRAKASLAAGVELAAGTDASGDSGAAAGCDRRGNLANHDRRQTARRPKRRSDRAEAFALFTARRRDWRGSKPAR